MDYVLTHAWLAWLGFAVLTALAEVALPYFTFILATFGALVAAAVSLKYPPVVQALAFCLATVASLVLVRPLRRTRHGLPSRSRLLIGTTGRVTTTLDPDGRVTVADEDWAARASDVIMVGRRVKVVGADGIVLLVEEDQDGITG